MLKGYEKLNESSIINTFNTLHQKQTLPDTFHCRVGKSMIVNPPLHPLQGVMALILKINGIFTENFNSLKTQKMKNNRSLALSTILNKKLKSGIILEIMGEHLDDTIFNNESLAKTRDRVFSPRNTLETMLLSATLEDKSLSNAVSQFYVIHQKKRELLAQDLKQQVEIKKERYQKKEKSKGRPPKFEVKLPKSKEKDVSLNTAAYSNARKRLPIELTESLFNSTIINDFKNNYSHWNGYKVLQTDGTYLQLQDNPEIREVFPIKNNSGSYPQALLETVIARGTGQIFSFKLGSRQVSELQLFNELLDNIPKQHIILMDDLYNSYEIMSKCISKNIHFTVPAKRKRNFKIIESYGKGDDIIEITKPESRSKWAKKSEHLLPKIKLRKIECTSPDGTEYVLFTSVLEKDIGSSEIQTLYLTRWDIEVSIREIKTIMNINVLRSKTPEMLKKELNVSLSAYNIIRKIIYASLKDLPFSPKEDFIYEFYSLDKSILIDKKGRVYKKWSTGRKRNRTTDPQADVA